MLLFSLLCSISLAAEHMLAVLPFEVHVDDDGLNHLGDGVAAMLVTDLQGSDSVRVVERKQLDAVLRELELSESDFVDPATVQRLGKGLGATEVVVGDVTVLGDNLRIDARVVNVETGEVDSAVSADGQVRRFFHVERQVAQDLLIELQPEAPIVQWEPVRAEDSDVTDPQVWRQLGMSEVYLQPIEVPIGAYVASAGLLVIVGTWGIHRSDPDISKSQWTGLQSANALGWIGLAGGGTLAVMQIQGQFK